MGLGLGVGVGSYLVVGHVLDGLLALVPQAAQVEVELIRVRVRVRVRVRG